jgi:hypothetical protein
MSDPRPTKFEIYWTRRRMWIAVTWSVMVFSLSGAFYFVVYLPVQERQRLDLAREEQAMRERIEQNKLDLEEERQVRRERLEDQYRRKDAEDKQTERYLLETCLQNSELTYVQLWDQECLSLKSAPDCRLPDGIADELNAHFGKLKDECFKRYPQGDPRDAI